MTEYSIPATKPCTKCGREFPTTLEFFYCDKRKRDGLGAWCKGCVTESNCGAPPSSAASLRTAHNMKQIPLSRGKFTIVDDIDYDWLMQWKWSYHPIGYAFRRAKEPERRGIYMHRILCDIPEGMQVDHINRNKLDNRRSNLRPATRSQNASNVWARGSSSYLGVSWVKQGQRWRAQIRINGKNTHIGYFDTEEEAARAYIAVAQKVHGEFCYNV